MCVEIPTIQTGIYRHFRRGDLYFMEGIREEAETDRITVLYTALYPHFGSTAELFPVGTKLGFCCPLGSLEDVVSDPNNTQTKRFILIQPLPVEKMQMLLPGKVVRHKEAMTPRFRVEFCSEQNNRITVYLVLVSGAGNSGLMDIKKFLEEHESIE